MYPINNSLNNFSLHSDSCHTEKKTFKDFKIWSMTDWNMAEALEKPNGVSYPFKTILGYFYLISNTKLDI